MSTFEELYEALCENAEYKNLNKVNQLITINCCEHNKELTSILEKIVNLYFYCDVLFKDEFCKFTKEKFGIVVQKSILESKNIICYHIIYYQVV
jgi:hypothetical protein